MTDETKSEAEETAETQPEAPKAERQPKERKAPKPNTTELTDTAEVAKANAETAAYHVQQTDAHLDKSIKDQIAAIEKELQAERVKNEQLRAESAKKDAEIADLRAEVDNSHDALREALSLTEEGETPAPQPAGSPRTARAFANGKWG